MKSIFENKTWVFALFAVFAFGAAVATAPVFPRGETGAVAESGASLEWGYGDAIVFPTSFPLNGITSLGVTEDVWDPSTRSFISGVAQTDSGYFKTFFYSTYSGEIKYAVLGSRGEREERGERESLGVGFVEYGDLVSVSELLQDDEYLTSVFVSKSKPRVNSSGSSGHDFIFALTSAGKMISIETKTLHTNILNESLPGDSVVKGEHVMLPADLSDAGAVVLISETPSQVQGPMEVQDGVEESSTAVGVTDASRMKVEVYGAGSGDLLVSRSTFSGLDAFINETLKTDSLAHASIVNAAVVNSTPNGGDSYGVFDVQLEGFLTTVNGKIFYLNTFSNSETFIEVVLPQEYFPHVVTTDGENKLFVATSQGHLLKININDAKAAHGEHVVTVEKLASGYYTEINNLGFMHYESFNGEHFPVLYLTDDQQKINFVSTDPANNLGNNLEGGGTGGGGENGQIGQEGESNGTESPSEETDSASSEKENDESDENSDSLEQEGSSRETIWGDPGPYFAGINEEGIVEYIFVGGKLETYQEWIGGRWEQTYKNTPGHDFAYIGMHWDSYNKN